MKNRTTIILSVLLILSIGNYLRIASAGTVRTVEFVSILAVGILIGALIVKVSGR